MTRIILIILFASFALTSFAQKQDSIFVQQGDDGWVIYHKVKQGQTVFSIARNYHIPPALLSDFNEVSLQQKLKPGSNLFVPLGAYNLKAESGIHTGEMRALYHRLEAGESLRRIAKNSNVSQKRLLDWNKITNYDLYEGMTLMVGWLLYDATGSYPTIKENNNVAKPIDNVVPQRNPPPNPRSTTKPDTNYYVVVDTAAKFDSALVDKSEAEILYDAQTINGTNIATEKGPAAFFTSKNPGASYYYAFHNNSPRGTIIKVRNTNNGKTVFVKVLGPIPTTGLYHNCIIGISSRARAKLGVRDEKAWCELTYGR